jgi:hypothetical protein
MQIVLPDIAYVLKVVSVFVRFFVRRFNHPVSFSVTSSRAQ